MNKKIKKTEKHEGHIGLFENYLLINDRSTIYLYYIRYFLNYCERNDVDITKIDYRTLTDYILEFKNRGCKNNYIDGLIRSIRSFYKCLYENNMVGEGVLVETKKMRLSRPVYEKKVFITKEELDDCIEMGMTFCEFMHPEKIKAILYFLFYTGVRLNEFIRLKRKDINLETRRTIIRLPTKNRREKIVLFPKIIRFRTKDRKNVDLVELFSRYFAMDSIEKINAFNVTKSQLLYLIKSIKDFVPKEKREHFSTHTFRHSFGSFLAKNNVDIRHAQKLFGHSSIQSTMIYYDPDIDSIQEVYDKHIK